MAYEKDYLDAVTITGIIMLVAPIVMGAIYFVLNINQSGLDSQDIGYFSGLFMTAGLLMILYVSYKRFRGK